ncbi:hypothetical protein LG634_20200 [Streptomyces bambusae]|uniref:hypothetical protein n=1 Tax=Streptomyces bambusae TaxID=1550616 RepID=UPI001CFEE89D|nr:hypothetical protein [Streptomyces bambusae]MCB5167152.1 hypothetical protein [Streptomyces bambusae]
MTGEPTSGMRRRPSVAVASIAAAVLLAGGGTAYWASTAYGDPAAPRSAAAADTRTADPTTPPPGIAPGEPDPSGHGVVYRAAGKLPEGPGRAYAYRIAGAVTQDGVARLASALGVPGVPRESGGLWRAGVAKDGSGPRLQVSAQAPGAWSFSLFQTGGSDDCERGKDTCGPAVLPEGGADGAGTPVGEEAAKAAAKPVLAAAGLAGAKLDASVVLGSARVVTADPVVGGLPVHGWSTKVHIGPDGQVVSGSGELSAPVRGDEQQVLSAARALERLNAGAPKPSIGGCATPVPDAAVAPDAVADPAVPCPPGSGTPGTPGPARIERVTGAVLGLTPSADGGTRQLVPAWLFSVAGRDGGPGHVVAQPAAAAGETRPEVRTVPGFSYEHRGGKLTVHFWGGVCSTYALEVREHPASVTVRVTETNPDPDRACIMIAQEMSLSAVLEQPLNAKRVVDGTTGDPLRRQ